MQIFEHKFQFSKEYQPLPLCLAPWVSRPSLDLDLPAGLPPDGILPSPLSAPTPGCWPPIETPPWAEYIGPWKMVQVNHIKLFHYS